MKPPFIKRATPVHTFLALLLAALCAVAVLFCYLTPAETGNGDLDALLNAILPRFFIAVLLLVIASESFSDCLVWRNLSYRGLLWCVPPLLVAVVNFPFSALLHGTARLLHAELIAPFLVKCLLIGLSEELLFRGILFSMLTDAFKNKGCFLPVLLSSLIFALFHFVNLFDGAGILAVLQQAGYSFLIGAMLAVLLLKTGNLWLCVFLHALFDFGGFFISDLGAGNPQDTVFWILTVAVGVLCAVHIIAALARLAKKR